VLSHRISPRLELALREAANGHRGPTLFFDLQAIRARMLRLADLQQSVGCRFVMAAKAFRAPRVYELAAELLAGFDVSNLNEYEELPGDLRGLRVSVSAPVLPSDLSALQKRGNALLVYLDAPDQLPRLRAAGAPVAFGIRLASTSFVAPGPRRPSAPWQESRFGVAARDVETLAALTACAPHRFAGFHLHHGFGGNTGEVYVELARGAVELAAKLGVELRVLDLGGGLHGIPEPELPGALARVREAVPAATELVFEPGALLSAGAGAALARVESAQPRDGALVCTLDLSAAWHLRWSDPVPLRAPTAQASARRRVLLFGPTCSEHDFLGAFTLPAEPGREPLAAGELLAFAGISGYSVSCNAGFNGIPPARVVLLE
jgi:diaminopimelate decarboxylase